MSGPFLQRSPGSILGGVVKATQRKVGRLAVVSVGSKQKLIRLGRRMSFSDALAGVD